MTEKRVGVRLVAEGGSAVRAEFEGMGTSGAAAFAKIDTGQKSAEDSARIFKAALDAEDASFKALRASVDPAFAALQRYERIVEETRRAVQSGVASQRQANDVLNLAKARYLDTGLEAQRFASRTIDMGRAGGRSGAQFQNASYQVGDFFVQIAAGTTASRALTMQLPQLLGGFGVAGAAAGAFVAIVGALAPMLFGAEEAVEDADQALGNFTSSLQDYQRFADVASRSTTSLREEFGRFGEEMRSQAAFMAELSLIDAQRGLSNLVDPLKAGIDTAMTRIADMQGAQQALLGVQQRAAEGVASSLDVLNIQNVLDVMTDSANEAASELGLTTDGVEALSDAIDRIGQAEGMEAMQAAAAQSMLEIRGLYEAADDIPPVINDILQSLGEISTQAAIGVLAMEDMSDEAVALREAEALAAEVAKVLADTAETVNFDRAVSSAAALAAQLNIAVSAASRIMGSPSYNEGRGRNGEIIFDPRDPRYRPTVARPTSGLGFVYNTISPFDPSRLASGDAAPRAPSSGAASRDVSPEMQRTNDLMEEGRRLTERLRTEQEKFNDDMARAHELLDAGAVSYETYVRQVEGLEENLREASDGYREMQSLIESGKDAMISAVMGEADAFDQLRDSIKRAAVEYLLFGSGPLGAVFGGADAGSGGGWGGLLGGLMNYEGGGDTGTGARSGGLDGRGGFPAILHPNETVIDHTTGSGAASRLHVSVGVDDSGSLMAVVRNEVGREIARSAPGIIDQSVAAVRRQNAKSKSFMGS